MNKLANARAKISDALFSNFGEQGLLVKRDNSESEIYLVKHQKSFSVGNKMLTTSLSIRIHSTVKPELYDQLKLGDKTYKLKASPKLLSKDIYEVNIE
ncbi:MAG TPA: hypothetical protein DCL21_07110 [Alphaproteobacteria bacterium]|nr:hypothetical protein [Alphaproteobacteria bacterium]